MIQLSKEAKELYRDEIQPLLAQNRVKECTDLLLEMNTRVSREVLAGLCEMGYAFVGYKIIPGSALAQTPITKVIVPEGVEEIGVHAFYQCMELTSIQLPDSLRIIRKEALAWCNSLTRVIIPEGVKRIEDVFYNCTNLAAIQLPKSIRSIHPCTFRYCESLKHVEIPEGVEKISKWAFYGCENLTSIQFPNSIRSIAREAFVDCPESVVFYIPKDLSWENVLEGFYEVNWYEKHSKVR